LGGKCNHDLREHYEFPASALAWAGRAGPAWLGEAWQPFPIINKAGWSAIIALAVLLLRKKKQ